MCDNTRIVHEFIEAEREHTCGKIQVSAALPDTSDLWPCTWAADDHLYCSWGDGVGFGAVDFNEQWGPARSYMGVSKVTGTGDNWQGSNIIGGKNPDSPDPLPDGKPLGIISIDGVLYLSVVQQDTWNKGKMCRSTDHGLTWTTTGESPCKLADESEATNHWDWSSPSQCPNNLPYCGFTSPGVPLQFGKDYQGARDGYVYYYIDESPNILLARVLKDQMMDRNQWQFFLGLNSSGSPTWSSNISDRQPVFTDAVNGIGWVVSVMYHPILHRYLLTTRPVGEFTNSSWGLFDAPEPWPNFRNSPSQTINFSRLTHLTD